MVANAIPAMMGSAQRMGGFLPRGAILEAARFYHEDDDQASAVA